MDDLPPIGMGTAVRDYKAFRALPTVVASFVAAGGRLIDTAPAYGAVQEKLGPVLSRVESCAALFLVSKISIPDMHVQKRTEHELVDCGNAVRALGFRTQKAPEGPKARKRIPNGPCAWSLARNGCQCEQDTKTTQLRCGACNGGKGAFWHLPCFFATHRCHFGS